MRVEGVPTGRDGWWLEAIVPEQMHYLCLGFGV